MADGQTESKPVDQDAPTRIRTELARTIDSIADRMSPTKNVDRAMVQIRQRAPQIDPLIAGVAAAVVVVGIAALLLIRRRKR